MGFYCAAPKIVELCRLRYSLSRYHCTVLEVKLKILCVASSLIFSHDASLYQTFIKLDIRLSNSVYCHVALVLHHVDTRVYDRTRGSPARVGEAPQSELVRIDAQSKFRTVCVCVCVCVCVYIHTRQY